MYAFLGELIAAGAMPYAKVFDARLAMRWVLPSKVGPIAATARLYDRMGLGRVGPLALVVPDDHAEAPASDFAPLADPVKLFTALEPARSWLSTVDGDGKTRA